MDQNRENDQLKTEMKLKEALLLLRTVREGGAAAEAARRQLRALREIRQSDDDISQRDGAFSVEPELLALLPKSCPELNWLDLRKTDLTDFSPLAGLPQLQTLYLDNTQISDLGPLAGLPQLQILSLNNTQVSDLSPLAGLSQLQRLSLDNTEVSELSPLAGLPRLQSLWLNNTQVSDLSPLESCKKLSLLFCRGLRLEEVPDFCLRQIFYFSLGDSTVARQPAALFQLPKEEVLAAYYDVDRVKVNEGKVIFLGESGVGKTHTIERIQAGGAMIDFREDTTPGVKIRPYSPPGRPAVKFWDFGCQEILQSMHHCFLTERSCYVIVVSGKDKDKVMPQAEKWLRTVAGYSRGVSVLLVVNQWHTVTAKVEKEVDEQKLRALCPALKAVIYYSAVDDSPEDFNKMLTKPIIDEVEKLDSVKLELPPAWAAIRDEMQKMQEKKVDFISFGDYLDVCARHGLGGESEVNASIRMWLLDWFNDLGVCFSYHQGLPQGAALMDCKVLNPDWLTNGVYRVLWNGVGCSGGGILSRAEFKELLTNRNLPTVDISYRYDGDGPNYILEIMRKFRRAYVLKDDRIFIPELMGVSPPPMLAPEGRPIRCTWQLTYLPVHLLHRVTLALYEHCDGAIWRYGIRLREGKDSLLLEAKPDERLLHLTLWRPEDGSGEPCGLFLEAQRLLLEAVADMRLVLEQERVRADWDGAVADYALEPLIKKYQKDPEKTIDNNEGEEKEFRVAELLEPLFGRTLLKAAQMLSGRGSASLREALNDTAAVLPYATPETVEALKKETSDSPEKYRTLLLDTNQEAARLLHGEPGRLDRIILLGLLRQRNPDFPAWLREHGTRAPEPKWRKLMLETKLEPGVNRDLLLWAADSPLYQEAVKDFDADCENLLKALGPNEGDRYRGSLELMRAIWNNHPELGLPPDYEHLTDLEFDKAFYPKYRDHTTHMFKVFLLGLYLYENQRRVRKAMDDVGLKDKAFLAVWILAALYHDAGYVIENDRTSGDDAAAAVVYQRMNEALSQPLTKLFTENIFGKGTEKGILARLGRQTQRIERMYPIKTALDRFIGKGKSVLLTIREDDNPIRSYFEQTQGKHAGRSYFDHGIVSAGMLLFMQQTLCKYYKEFPKEELNSVQQGKLQAMRDAAPAYEDYAERAAYAVALHNIKKDWNGERMTELAIEGVRLGDFRIPLETGLEPGCGPEPVAWLLRLCDELQCWDRQYYGNPEKLPSPLKGAGLHFQGEDESLSLKIEDPAAKKGITDALEGILTPPASEVLNLKS
ncbi:MAG: leucine-rich repeat domain-containing protein [Oscillospiraceae bacterium]|nr:leucine-rich repeat domain-containing protein [Oscillospiraceae bacterium]